MFYLLCALLGLIIGSFLNVVIYRLPRGMSVVRPRSFCPACQKQVAWYDNIPLLSLLWLHGKCRHCGSAISWRYPLVELLTMTLSTATYYHFGSVVPYLLHFLFFVAPMIAIVFIDLEHLLIPDVITLPGIVLGVAVRWVLVSPFERMDFFWDSIIGILVGGGFLFLIAWGYEKLKKREGLGGGDVKLAAMFGAFFGWQAVVFILLMASVVGTVFGLALIAFRKKSWQAAFPFGPFLVVASLLYLYFGETILSWYLRLI